MLKLLVIGNCQARPISVVLGKSANVCLLEPIIVHLERDDNKDRTISMMEEADVIFAQLTADNFPIHHLRTSVIKSLYPKKIFVWPNIFYIGQQPNLRYITHVKLGRVLGPLAEYHDLDLFQMWRRDNQLELLPSISTPDLLSNQSLNQLQERENLCDIKITDIIEKEKNSRRLFFTFNHPANFLLSLTAKRLCQVAGLWYADAADDKIEALGKIIPPSNFDEFDTLYHGVDVSIDSNKILKMGRQKVYERSQLIATVFSCYDAQKDILSELTKLRFTPQF